MKLFEKSMKHSVFEMKRVVIGRKTIEELKKEERKIEKMLNILKREYTEGIISKQSYEELKSKNEERLTEIRGKIGERS